MESYNPANALRTLKVLHWGITGGSMIFAVIVFFLITSSGQAQWIDRENILSFLPIGFGLFLISLSSFLFRTLLKENLKDKTELSQKLAAFQTSHIVKMAMLEGAVLFAIVGSFVTNTYANLGLLGLVLPIMFLAQPSVFSLVEALELSQEESKMLEN